MEVVKFKFYATLLDAYQNYLDSDIIWSKYWGWSENPPHTPEEFKKIQFQSLIDKINRVPFDSEAADKGTAFNEVIDCMVLHRNSTLFSKMLKITTMLAKERLNHTTNEYLSVLKQS